MKSRLFLVCLMLFFYAAGACKKEPRPFDAVENSAPCNPVLFLDIF